MTPRAPTAVPPAPVIEFPAITTPAKRKHSGYVLVNGVKFMAWPWCGATASEEIVRRNLGKLAADWIEGAPQTVICDLWGTSKFTLRRMLQSLGVELRKRGGRQKSHPTCAGRSHQPGERKAVKI